MQTDTPPRLGLCQLESDPLEMLGDLWQAVAMGNKDARSREKKKPKKQPAPKVYQPTVSTIVKPTAPKT
jgi:hypothetical protein